MTAAVAAPSDRRRRRAKATAFGIVVAAVLAPAAGGTPAGANGLTWEVRWAAPTTTAGPNATAVVPQLAGTAAPPLAGNPSRVDYTVTVPAGFPAACAVAGGAATVNGQAFSFKPAFTCNGTYGVAVVARNGSGLLSSASPKLSAPVALADPGPAPTGISGAADGRTNTVAVGWRGEADPDVVGYRIRRDGQPVADVAAGTVQYTGQVPGPGRYTFDVQALRWGAGGPGSPSIASPASAPFTATLDPARPTNDTGSGGGGGSGGTGSGGGGTTPGGGTTAGGSTLPPGKTATPTLPKRAPASGGSTRSTYRSGGTIARSAPTTEVDTYQERLPYEAKDTGRNVELASPDSTRTVARRVITPGREGPGLVVPAAVVLVLVAASLQIRAFLHRTAPAAIAVDHGPPPPEG